MPQAGVCVLAGLISGVSAALILASSPSHTEPHSPQGTTHNATRGQSTYNECRANSCQIAHLNTVEDFCLWAPSQPAPSANRNTEHALDAWCIKSAHGARLIPDGTISAARLIITPEYIQITGVGNLTNINVPADGVASASGEGDRLHGLVFTSAYGRLEQIYNWTSFVSQERFCFRACKPSSTASTTCPRIYDSSGCLENAPGDYDTGASENYIGAEAPLALYQEVLAAPLHYSTSNAQAARARRAILSISGSTSSTLVTSFSHRHPGSYTQSTSLASFMVPTTTDTATTITFPSFPTSTLTNTTSMSSSTPVLSATPMSIPYSRSYTNTHSNWHSFTHRHSRHHSSTSSPSISSSSSHHSLSHSRSSSSIVYLPSSFGDASTTYSMSSLASSIPSFASTPSTYSSSDPSGTSTPTSTPTLAPTSASTSSFPSSSDGMSSSLSGISSAQPSISTPSSAVSPTSSLTSSLMPPLTSSQSSDVLTFTTSLSSSSVPATSPATPSSTLPNSQTQVGSQCLPPLLVTVNAGSIVPSPTLLSLMLTILMIVMSSSVNVFIP